jgi:uncharacterized protein
MLSFDLRALDAHAIAVDGVLPPDDPVWIESDPRPAAEGVRVTGRLSTAGPGRYYFSGALDGAVDAECRRCLTDVRAPVEDELHVVFADADDAEVDDDPDVYRLDPRSQELDLRPAIREQWLLSVPAFVECRADCKGLCPSCGADRNTDACRCETAAVDPRWDALRSLRGESS